MANYQRRRIRIWGKTVPYNTGREKKRDMVVSECPKVWAQLGWNLDVFGRKLSQNTKRLDTYTWMTEIKPGNVSDRYDDVPYLIPYLVESGNTAVIIAPGGGFCGLARSDEGTEIAEYLNKNGISAFVLEYRLNPYRAPVCFLDVQRAVRYVRVHASDYGIDPARIGTLGFSAGGYAVAGGNIFYRDGMEGAVGIPDYEPDKTDLADGRANFIGLIYPVVSFDRNPNMLSVLSGEDLHNPLRREELQKYYSLTRNLTKDSVPQFLCYGTRERLEGVKAYEKRLKDLKIVHKTVSIEGAFHGFALNNPKYAWWIDRYVEWIDRLAG